MARKKRSPPERGSAGADRETAAPLLAKPVIWVGSSNDDISALPGPVKASFGHRFAPGPKRRNAARHETAYAVWDRRIRATRALRQNAYRLVYVVNLEKAIYVLHAFMKKSKSGIGLPRQDVELIEARSKRAHTLDAED